MLYDRVRLLANGNVLLVRFLQHKPALELCQESFEQRGWRVIYAGPSERSSGYEIQATIACTKGG